MKPEEFGRELAHIMALPGWLSPSEASLLHNLAMATPGNAAIVEIGAFSGRSTCALAAACPGTRRRVYSIDTWEMCSQDLWRKVAGETGLMKYVTPVKSTSAAALSAWGTDPIHLLFIDACHMYEHAREDFLLGHDLLADGAWVAFHDGVDTHPGVIATWLRYAQRMLETHVGVDCILGGRKPPDPTKLPIYFVTDLTPATTGQFPAPDPLLRAPFRWRWLVFDHGVGLPESLTKLRAPHSVRIPVWNGADKPMVLNTLTRDMKEDILFWQVGPEGADLTRAEGLRRSFLANPAASVATDIPIVRWRPGLVWSSYSPLGVAKTENNLLSIEDEDFSDLWR
jgi:predicted O-methyltransferase YrrM